MATTAVANTVPAGSAIGIGMTYGTLGSCGYSRSRSTTAVLVSLLPLAGLLRRAPPTRGLPNPTGHPSPSLITPVGGR
jgi:hypothetical protein